MRKTIIALITLTLVILASLLYFYIGMKTEKSVQKSLSTTTTTKSTETQPLVNTRNGIEEKVSLGFDGEYYVFVNFTNVGQKPIVIHTINLFRPNSTITGFSLLAFPFTIKILDLNNGKTYALFPSGVFFPIVTAKNFTFYPGETIWFKYMIYYVCNMNFSIFSPFPCSHLVVLPPGEYKLLINSSLTNTTMCLPFNVSIPLGDYVFAKNNTIYAVLPPNVSQVEINGIISKVVFLGNFTYEVVNSQEILNNLGLNSTGNSTAVIPMEINVWINGKEYCLYAVGISYTPRLI
ncbi:hypothetical protein WIW90_07990 [Sulfolobaceae archaeon RB850M]